MELIKQNGTKPVANTVYKKLLASAYFKGYSPILKVCHKLKSCVYLHATFHIQTRWQQLNWYYNNNQVNKIVNKESTLPIKYALFK